MNQDRIEGMWDQLRGKIVHAWGKLTDDDVESARGNLLELRGKIQERYGYGKEQVEREMNEFLEREGLGALT